MNMSKLAMVVATTMLMSCADAQNAKEEAQLRKALAERLGDVKIDSIKKTPYADLYEIRVGSDIRYTDKTGSYLMVGHIFDLKTSQDLTQARIDDINKINFDELPKELALKTVKGNGKRVMAIFEDPNCGYCKRFRQTTLANIDNVTVYTYMYNILSPDSFTKSQNIWCAADRNKAWDDWMLAGKAAPTAPNGCTSPNDKVLALGQKININGTPAIFFADGSRIAGAVDQRTLEAKFATIK
ncbi:thioredoxin fold domain-containing protein [Pseudoduganella sp. DS3]|uniref:Thiol:disulfide interchange protein n=1 Tax=Pseudoduganella guangdongensis TaxID=2692179 RepID=A0A6N9HHW3_9BURK|nr:DsbC family protein [Pseudoduganella guangdongensis]MYN02612.1 thioredoxin fold domain-containing protein [Pseudoduganella guangdongensis]